MKLATPSYGGEEYRLTVQFVLRVALIPAKAPEACHPCFTAQWSTRCQKQVTFQYYYENSIDLTDALSPSDAQVSAHILNTDALDSTRWL